MDLKSNLGDSVLRLEIIVLQDQALTGCRTPFAPMKCTCLDHMHKQ